MPQTRPRECPACGYERVQRTPEPARTAEERRAGVARWMCRLCEYEWLVGAEGRPEDDWAVA
jgi:rubredoxin